MLTAILLYFRVVKCYSIATQAQKKKTKTKVLMPVVKGRVVSSLSSSFAYLGCDVK